MRTNISLPKDDLCEFCFDGCKSAIDNPKCPENIYDCEVLQSAMNEKKAVYKWIWVKKDKSKMDTE